MIPLDEALRLVLEATPRLPAGTVPLAEAAGAWLAEPVVSDVDLPPADVSAMDGFALRAADAAAVPAELEIVGEVAAGAAPSCRVGSGEAVRIMTGALIPPGADAVQMVEKTTSIGGGRVRIDEPVAAGAHIRRGGENLRRGATIVEAGSRLGPAELGLLASAGRDPVLIHRRAQVAVLPTGDELVEPGETPGPGQIRNSNGPTLRAQVAAEGAVAVYRGIARDEPGELDRRIEEAAVADLVLLTGGVSMGVYDLVTDALRRAAFDIAFEKVAIKPGKPTVFGLRTREGRTTLAFGLPGNPVSAMVVFRLLVAPALRRLHGATRVIDARPTARITGSVPPTPRREAFHPARIAWSESGYRAEPIRHHGSGDLVAWRQANGMIRLAADVGADEGARVQVLLDRDHDLR